MSSRMSIPEIADRLSVGRIAVYTMLEQGSCPASDSGIGGLGRVRDGSRNLTGR